MIFIYLQIQITHTTLDIPNCPGYKLICKKQTTIATPSLGSLCVVIALYVLFFFFTPFRLLSSRYSPLLIFLPLFFYLLFVFRWSLDCLVLTVLMPTPLLCEILLPLFYQTIRWISFLSSSQSTSQSSSHFPFFFSLFFFLSLFFLTLSYTSSSLATCTCTNVLTPSTANSNHSNTPVRITLFPLFSFYRL